MTPEETRAYNASYRKANRERIKAIQSRWIEKNKSELIAKARQRAIDNPDKIKAYHAKYRSKNADKIRERSRRWAAKKRRDDPEGQKAKLKEWRSRNSRYKLVHVLRSRLQSAIRKGVGSSGKKCDKTLNLLGCSVDELKAHLEKLFQPGMSWDNHGINGWHIDHIRPCASFDLTDPDQQRQCFHWSNLQPLWANDNWAKGGQAA